MLNGTERSDRTGVGTRGVFGYHFRHNMAEGFPLLTTKKIHLRSVIHELIWFLSGSTNIAYLRENGVTIWDEWADASGELGPVYGAQWRCWLTARGGVVDQVGELVEALKKNPFSRRHMVSAWNVEDVPKMALPPCHLLWQCHIEEREGRRLLNLQMYQRSADLFLGVPFNIASYAMLLSMLANVCGYAPGELCICFGDLHIYKNHFEQVGEQFSRQPGRLPILTILNDRAKLEDFIFDDFRVEGYSPAPAIKAPIAV